MTGRHQSRARGALLAVDLRTLPRRAAAQAGPLLLLAVLVALVVAPVSAVPRAVARVADAAVQDAVARAGTDADVVVTTTTGYADSATGVDTEAAASASAAADAVAAGLAAQLGDLFAPPVVTTASVPLTVVSETPVAGERTVRLVWTGGRDDVEWTSGDAPGATEPGTPGTPGAPAPVEVGLSAPVATVLGTRVGDTLEVRADDGTVVALRVTGVYRPRDPEGTRREDAPDLLEPRVATLGPSTSTQVAALLSDGSLPAALAVVDPRQVQRTVRVAFEPGALDAPAAARVLAGLPRLQASPATLGPGAGGGSLHSGAVGVLRDAVAALDAARAVAAALVVGVVLVGALLLTLTAGLLARRRAAELATRRTRGASLPALAVEGGAEALVVVAAGTGAGALAADALVPGPVPVGSVLLVAGVAVVALVVVALRVARQGGDPAGHPAGTRVAGTPATARRVAAELALLALGAASVTTLAARGTAADGDGGTDLLAAAAPALLAAVGAALVARVLPAVLHRLGPLAERSRRAVPVLAVARARSDGLASLPLLVVATAAALVVVSASAAQVVRADQVARSWTTTGGDVRVSTDEPDPALAAAARTWTEQPGVEAAVAARVVRDVPARTADGSARVDVVLGDPRALTALAAALPPAPPAATVAEPGPAGERAAPPSGETVLRWDGEDRTVHVLAGTPAPPLAGGAGRAVVVVDVAELGGGASVPPTVVWVVGPGAAEAVAGHEPPDGAAVVTRTAVLADLRADVLARALAGAAVASGALLLAFVALAVLVAAAGGGPARRRALDTLRTVGLTDREAQGVAAGEVLPGSLGATAAGAVLGGAVAAAVLAPLGLAAAGSGTVAWPSVALPVAAGLVADVLVLAAEHGRRRTHRLGEVLRTAG